MADTPREPRRSTRNTRNSAIGVAQGDSPADTPSTKKRRAEDDIGRSPGNGKAATKDKASSRAKGVGSKRKPSGRPSRKSSSKATPDIASLAGDSPVDEERVELLPNRVVDGEPLPTLRNAQTNKLNAEDYQTIAQSGVLAAALKRSREAWVNGIHFKKYWSKPVLKKPKDRTEADKEAMLRDKLVLKNMVKIGECDLTIDPHIFRVALWMNRETHPPPAPRQQQVWTHSKPAQNSGPRLHMPHPNTPSSAQPPARNAQQASPLAPVPTSSLGQNQRISAAPSQNGPVNAVTSRPMSTEASMPNNQPSTSMSETPPDPVIQMLAQRAGRDTKLKEVMKIVANGNANDAQLAYFQAHISELTKVVEDRKRAEEIAAAKRAANEAAKLKLQNSRPTVPAQPPPAQSGHVSAQSQVHTKSPAPASQNTGNGTGTVPTTHQSQPTPSLPVQKMPLSTPSKSQYQPPPSSRQPHSYSATQSQKPTYSIPPPVAQPAPTFRPIFFEFLEGPGDRLVFPEQSILEYLSGGRQVRFSFLITMPDPVASPPPALSSLGTPVTPVTAKVESAVGPATVAAPVNVAQTQNMSAPESLTIPTAIGAGSPSVPPTPTTIDGASSKAPVAAQAESPKNGLKVPDWSKLIPPGKTYQPVTGTMSSDNPRTLECFMRAVRHPSDVSQYMDAIFDAMEQAEDRYLAFRLPKENQLKDLEDVEAEKENDTPNLNDAKRRRVAK